MVHDYDGLIYVIEVSGETIEVTDNHPFWVVDGTDIFLRPEAEHSYDYERGSAANGLWVDSEDLRPGDRLRLFDGQTAPITSITTYPAKIKVYNLAVAEYHNYAVTASGVLVHNRRTLPNTTQGWKVGNPINNLTSKGNVPKWSTVRQRYWKNEGLNNAGSYNQTNIARMKNGLAPQKVNPVTGKIESMELHHTPPQRDGGLFDVIKVWPDDHAAVDVFRNTGR